MIGLGGFGRSKRYDVSIGLDDKFSTPMRRLSHAAREGLSDIGRDAHKADREISDLSRGLSRMERILERIKSSQALSPLANVSEVFGGITNAIGTVTDALGTLQETIGVLEERGREVQNISNTFEDMARHIGASRDVMLELEGITSNILSRADLQRGANLLIATGAAGTQSELTNIIELATKLGMSMGQSPSAAIEEFSLLLANQSIERLDVFGIGSSSVRATRDRLKEEGVSPDEAFTRAVLEEGQKALLRQADSIEKNTLALDVLSARMANTGDQISASVHNFMEGAAKIIVEATPDDSAIRSELLKENPTMATALENVAHINRELANFDFTNSIGWTQMADAIRENTNQSVKQGQYLWSRRITADADFDMRQLQGVMLGLESIYRNLGRSNISSGAPTAVDNFYNEVAQQFADAQTRHRQALNAEALLAPAHAQWSTLQERGRGINAYNVTQGQVDDLMRDYSDFGENLIKKLDEAEEGGLIPEGFPDTVKKAIVDGGEELSSTLKTTIDSALLNYRRAIETIEGFVGGSPSGTKGQFYDMVAKDVGDILGEDWLQQMKLLSGEITPDTISFMQQSGWGRRAIGSTALYFEQGEDREGFHQLMSEFINLGALNVGGEFSQEEIFRRVLNKWGLWFDETAQRPGGGVQHVVAEGEHLGDLSRIYGVPMEDILRANPDPRRTGDMSKFIFLEETLNIGGPFGMIRGSDFSQPGRSAIQHTVGEGETVWELSQRYGVPIEEILASNPSLKRQGGQSHFIYEGETLNIGGKPRQIGVSGEGYEGWLGKGVDPYEGLRTDFPDTPSTPEFGIGTAKIDVQNATVMVANLEGHGQTGVDVYGDPIDGGAGPGINRLNVITAMQALDILADHAPWGNQGSGATWTPGAGSGNPVEAMNTAMAQVVTGFIENAPKAAAAAAGLYFVNRLRNRLRSGNTSDSSSDSSRGTDSPDSGGDQPGSGDDGDGGGNQPGGGGDTPTGGLGNIFGWPGRAVRGTWNVGRNVVTGTFDTASSARRHLLGGERLFGEDYMGTDTDYDGYGDNRSRAWSTGIEGIPFDVGARAVTPTPSVYYGRMLEALAEMSGDARIAAFGYPDNLLEPGARPLRPIQYNANMWADPSQASVNAATGYSPARGNVFGWDGRQVQDNWNVDIPLREATGQTRWRTGINITSSPWANPAERFWHALNQADFARQISLTGNYEQPVSGMMEMPEWVEAPISEPYNGILRPAAGMTGAMAQLVGLASILGGVTLGGAVVGGGAAAGGAAVGAIGTAMAKISSLVGVLSGAALTQVPNITRLTEVQNHMAIANSLRMAGASSLPAGISTSVSRLSPMATAALLATTQSGGRVMADEADPFPDLSPDNFMRYSDRLDDVVDETVADAPFFPEIPYDPWNADMEWTGGYAFNWPLIDSAKGKGKSWRKNIRRRANRRRQAGRGTAAGTRVRVKRGDTIGSLALEHGVDPAFLQEELGSGGSLIQEGAEFEIPDVSQDIGDMEDLNQLMEKANAIEVDLDTEKADQDLSRLKNGLTNLTQSNWEITIKALWDDSNLPLPIRLQLGELIRRGLRDSRVGPSPNTNAKPRANPNLR